MKYFKAFELVDKDTYEKMGEEALSLFTPASLQALDDLREFFGCPIIINDWHCGGDFQWRGWRTTAKAAELGAPHSQHALGNAFDCTVFGLTAPEARRIILANQDKPLLQKITRLEDGVSWVHLDCMELSEGIHRIHLFKS